MSVVIELEMPGDLKQFRLPKGVNHRLQELLPDALTDLPEEVRTRLRSGPIKVVITQGDEDAGPSAWESIGRKVAPTLVSTAVGTVMSHVMGRTPEPGSSEE